MISHLEYRPTCRPTVNARELGGPHGKLGPDNTWLNEFGFFLLKVIAIIHQQLTEMILVSCSKMYYCNSKKNLISLSQVLSGPSLPWGPSSPAFTVRNLPVAPPPPPPPPLECKQAACVFPFPWGKVVYHLVKYSK